jgi:hemolysin III
MAKRIKLRDRLLPSYSRGEEIMNMVTHIVGGGLGILILVACLLKGIFTQSALSTVGAAIYGGTMVCLYTVSSIYHGLRPSTGKKVMQIIDHCTIYFLICGTYTPILLTGFVPVYPVLGWSLLGVEWALAILAATLTAIDLKKYNVFSMICYIFMGWGIIFFLPQALAVLTKPGFLILLSGGIAYTAGAILYGIGSKIPWFHSVFHIFVVLGSVLQFLAIILYVL